MNSGGRVSDARAGWLLPGLVAGVCYLGLVTNREQAAGLAAGVRLDLSQATSNPWQYVREAVTLALLGALVRRRERRSVRLLAGRWVWLLGTLVALVALATLLRGDLPVGAVLTGLRFVYIAGVAVAVARLSPAERRTLLPRVAWLLVPLLLVEAVLAFGQVRQGPSTLGTTQLGFRPWGTYASSNNLGLFALGVGAVLAVTRIRWSRTWLAVVGATCLATGSRTAVLGFCLVVGGLLAAHWKRRLGFAPLAAVGLYVVYGWASSEQVSGRVIDGEARFETWRTAWSTLSGWERVFGAGIGSGTNSLVALTGYQSGANVSDSAFVAALLSLGVIGLAGYVAAYGALWRVVSFERRLILLPMLGLTLVSFNAPEVSPFNLLLAVVIGCSVQPDATTAESPVVDADAREPRMSSSETAAAATCSTMLS